MYFSKTLIVLSAALSALASPHIARAPNHHALAHRAAIPDAAPEPVVEPKKIRRRADTSRCKVRSSSAAPAATSSVSSSTSRTTVHAVTPSTSSSSSSSSSSSTLRTSAAHSSSIVPPKNVGGDPTSAEVEPTTEPPKPTTTKAQTPTEKPTTTKQTTAAPEPTKTSSGGSGNDPLGILSGGHTGEGTFYNTGLVACGTTHSDSELIVALSQNIFDKFPGYAGGNPNNNPLCGRKIKATYKGKSVTVTAVDRCVGCASWDLDFSPAAFQQLASFDLGRIYGVQWQWV
ncbi:RlpA-like double-psi beta-barrel-protein domain-containing protein-containing protein [Fomes fomentarius]|nr:RlpA-like double-psi beta-barrel-protein domain-containing protein-containing protein [Fomes fomentarius]